MGVRSLGMDTPFNGAPMTLKLEPTGDSLPNWTATNTNWGLIPEHMRQCVIDYVETGFLSSDFLSAVLENNLRRAVESADDINQDRLKCYVQFFFNYTPSACWGNVEKVKAWQQRKGLQRGT